MIRNLAVHSLIILSFGMLAVADAAMTLIVDDFDNGVFTNTVGQETGIWNCNFDDTE